MKRGFLLILAAVFIVAVFSIIFSLHLLDAYNVGSQTANPLPTDKIIVANFVNLSQIQAIYPFRSCHGHDYYSVDYNGSSEPLSSMKWYVQPVGSLQNTSNQVEIFAPFNGVIVYIDPMDTQRGRHYVLMHEPFDGWYISFFHQNFNDSAIYEGEQVKAGQLLSYAVTVTGLGTDFDVALQRFPTESTQFNGKHDNYNGQIALLQNLEPLFPHMSDSVAAQWESVGINASNSIVIKSYREANPCTCEGEPPGTTDCYFHNPAPGVSLT